MPAPKPDKKYFTPEEANNALPLVRAIAADIVRQFRDIHERTERLNEIKRLRGKGKKADRAAADVYSEEVAQVEEQLEKDVEVLQGYVDELHKLGVELKDPSKGLLDFPAIMDGREIYLCWHLGEDEVAYWHELDAGFAGRRSLMAGLVTGEENEDDSTVGGE